jgi:hypothetical protein
VHPGPIVVAEARDLSIAQVFIEGDRDCVLDGGLQPHPPHPRRAKPAFELDQKPPTEALSTCRGRHIERDDLPPGAAGPPAEHEADDGAFTLGHDGFGRLQRKERSQFGFRVGDVGRKASAVELPDRLEVGAAVVAKVHGSSIAIGRRAFLIAASSTAPTTTQPRSRPPL